MANPAQQQYLRTQVRTATPEQLVLMLYNGVIRFCEQAKAAIAEKEYETSHNAIRRTNAILMELFSGLNFKQGEDIAINLGRLYSYCMQRLVDANMQHDISHLEEVQKVFRNLREGWMGAMDSNASESETEHAENIELTETPKETATSQPAIPQHTVPAPAAAKIPEPAQIPPKRPASGGGGHFASAAYAAMQHMQRLQVRG